MIRSVAVLDERRGGSEISGGCNVETNKSSVDKDLCVARGDFEARSGGERVEMCSGLSDDSGRCFRGAMVQEAGLVNMDGCVIDEGASERRGGAKIEFGV